MHLKKAVRYLPEIALFLTVFIVYLICLPPSITFWDSAEFVTGSSLFVPTHAPGAPLYSMICGAILSVFPVGSHAFVSNVISAFFGALAVVGLYKVIFIAVKFLLNKKCKTERINTIFCSLLGALTFAFCITFWTSATETEVYTLSFSFYTWIIFLMLKFYALPESSLSHKYMLLIALLLGLTIGVHPLNLALLIPFGILLATRLPIKKKWQTITGILLGGFTFLLLYSLLIPGFLSLAQKLDVWLVNYRSLPKNSGFVSLVILGGILMFTSIYYLKQFGFRQIASALILVSIFTIGASSYLLPVLRSNNLSIAGYAPETAERLKEYFQAEQFGVDEIPLISGAVFNAPLDFKEPLVDGSVTRVFDESLKRYIITDSGKFTKPRYASEFNMLFPRMYHKSAINAQGYKDWAIFKGEPVKYQVRDSIITIQKPTQADNFSFFYNYQFNWMYWRYLMWNFAGRQNDLHGKGAIYNGNWQSGLSFLDADLKEAENAREFYKNRSGKVHYYGIPLFFATLGLLFLLVYHRKLFYFFSALFLLYGVGIVVFVNMPPLSIYVRERDYIYIGSFAIASVFVGLSPLWLLRFKQVSQKVFSVAIVVVILLIPGQFLAKGFADHDRGDEVFAESLAKTYLDSCPQNALLITNGDNFTFPLWYLQEVLKYRPDVTVINRDMLNLDWYIKKLDHKKFDLQLSLPFSAYAKGSQTHFPLNEIEQRPIDLKAFPAFVSNKNNTILWNGKQQYFVPTKTFSLTTDANYWQPREGLGRLQRVTWQWKKDFYERADVVLLDILQANFNRRPITFLNNGKADHKLNLGDALEQNGLVEQLVPYKPRDPNANPKLVNTQAKLNFDFAKYNAEHQLEAEALAYVQEIIRPAYYFTAQALIERGNFAEAKEHLDACMKNFDASAVPYKQYAFALGRLYDRVGDKALAKSVCIRSYQTVKQELEWMISTDPARPVVNIRTANTRFNILQGMFDQLGDIAPNFKNQETDDYMNFVKQFENWRTENWPY